MMTALVSIILPTYNEAPNLAQLITRLDGAMRAASLAYEAIVVDDNSSDGTYQIACELGKQYPIQALLRTKERGLSSAILYGFHHAKSNIFGVMDADLQHPPELVLQLTYAITHQGYHMAIASRFITGAKIANCPALRRALSNFARLLVFPITKIHDSTSGFFFLNRQVITNVPLHAVGYKLGLEIITKGRHQGKIKELPYVFSPRTQGISKLNAQICWAYLKQIAWLYGDAIYKY